jgi:hypothetical protein
MATDNSGNVPTVTHDAGAAVKEFEIRDTHYIVKYTATDEAGNKGSCFLHITVKGKDGLIQFKPNNK